MKTEIKRNYRNLNGTLRKSISSAADRFFKNEQYKEISKNSVFGFFGNLTGGWIIVFLLYVKITYHVSEERVLLHISHLEVVTVK